MSSRSIEDERRVGEIQREGSGCSYSVQKRRDRFMVKTRFDASVAEFQQSIPDPQQSVSERVADSRDPIPGRVPDSQQRTTIQGLTISPPLSPDVLVRLRLTSTRRCETYLASPSSRPWLSRDSSHTSGW
uniref:Uncharacterized protein n=1 Tax=Ananas comosus var. bracteatus TaxID=296719 RepID=A0A6V7NMA5_ANACO|nr:unnamed protein product [Ananas comosus var. bracteatus]